MPGKKIRPVSKKRTKILEEERGNAKTNQTRHYSECQNNGTSDRCVNRPHQTTVGTGGAIGEPTGCLGGSRQKWGCTRPQKQTNGTPNGKGRRKKKQNQCGGQLIQHKHVGVSKGTCCKGKLDQRQWAKRHRREGARARKFSARRNRFERGRGEASKRHSKVGGGSIGKVRGSSESESDLEVRGGNLGLKGPKKKRNGENGGSGATGTGVGVKTAKAEWQRKGAGRPHEEAPGGWCTSEERVNSADAGTGSRWKKNQTKGRGESPKKKQNTSWSMSG